MCALLDAHSSVNPGKPRNLGKILLGGRTSLEVACEFDPESGRLKRKIERAGQGKNEREDIYIYSYDGKGHLTEVLHNHLPMEKYEYNGQGQRWCRQSEYSGECDYYVYEKDDSLWAAGRDNFEYDHRGNTIARKRGNEQTMYAYQRGVLLERVALPDGRVISYVYAKEVPPVARYLDGRLSAEYAWQSLQDGIFLLSACRDHEQGLEFQFSYADRHCPEKVSIRRLSNNANNIWEKLNKNPSESLELFCGCDQVGSLKRLADAAGNEIKYVNYDSFGNIVEETFPELGLPLGFASGLWDHESGLIRFGRRDYDPYIGRFLCPDPLGDTGGDHDPYDYCVDDPISYHDPNGLWTKATFVKSMVDRDGKGCFTSTGGSSKTSANVLLRGSSEANESENIPKAINFNNWHINQRNMFFDHFLLENTLEQPAPHDRQGEYIPFAAGNDEKKTYYVVGRRELSGLKGSLYNDRTSTLLEHRHFIANNGENFGRLDQGAVPGRHDDPGNMPKYRFHSTVRYDAQLIDQAREIMDDYIASGSPLDGQAFRLKWYGLTGNDCQGYTQGVIKIAKHLGEEQGRKLILD